MDGEGKYTSEKGRVRIGIWKEGKRQKWIEKETDNPENDIQKTYRADDPVQ